MATVRQGNKSAGYLAVEYRTVGELNRVVIPESIRKILRLNIGDEISISTDGKNIIIAPALKKCDLCGGLRGLRRVRGAKVCEACAFYIVEKFAESEVINNGSEM